MEEPTQREEKVEKQEPREEEVEWLNERRECGLFD